MNQTLARAYKIIFDHEPAADLKDWQIAAQILERWNVSKIGVRDPSMDIYEWLENKYWESKEKENGGEVKIK